MGRIRFARLFEQAGCRAVGSALLASALILQGCAVAERSWDATKSASGKAWSATRTAGGNVKDFVLRKDASGNRIGFEYQWQIMTIDTRQIASEDLFNGRAALSQQGLAGGAACAVVDAEDQSIDIQGSVGSPIASATLEAAGFSVTQVGSLQTHRQCSPTTLNSPAQMTIMTDRALTVGAPMHGRALVHVGGRIYDSLGLYFKFKLDSVDVNSQVVTGQFEFMAQDQTNPDNRETLLVNSGKFSIKL